MMDIDAKGLRSLADYPDSIVVGKHFSSACYVEQAVPATLYLALKHHNSVEDGLVANTMCGGDNAGRGAVPGKDTYIEAGSIHLLLRNLLAKGLSKEWRLRIHDIDGEAIKMLNLHGSLFSPGDELTLDYIFNRGVSRKKWQLCCAQSLIYSKIITKEELSSGEGEFPHTRDEIETIALVKQLSVATCATIFQRIRALTSADAAALTAQYVRLNSVRGP